MLALALAYANIASVMGEQPVARQLFAREIGQSEDGFDLARAALYVAQEEYPTLEVERYVGWLDTVAETINAQLGHGAGIEERLSGVRTYLFETLGLSGNADDYYDPRNSFLNEVIDRRTGIPITLSVVFLEVGWRLGLPTSGVGLPGHFVVRVDDPERLGEPLALLDPFNRGALLTFEDCARIVARMSGGSGAEAVAFRPEMLRPVTRRQIVTRMLNNLKAIYVRSGDDERAIAAIDRLLILDPRAAGEVRDRALLYARRGRYARALEGLTRYLELAPGAPDRDEVTRQIAQVRQLLSRMN